MSKIYALASDVDEKDDKGRLQKNGKIWEFFPSLVLERYVVALLTLLKLEVEIV